MSRGTPDPEGRAAPGGTVAAGRTPGADVGVQATGQDPTAASEAAVLAAARALVAAFGAHDAEAYFACFDPDATFLFHTTPDLVRSREAYRALWAAWEADGFRVLACESSEPAVQLVRADVAVFTHRVRTRQREAEGEREVLERETIVFRRTEGRWLGVHEHLSPAP